MWQRARDLYLACFGVFIPKTVGKNSVAVATLSNRFFFSPPRSRIFKVYIKLQIVPEI